MIALENRTTYARLLATNSLRIALLGLLVGFSLLILLVFSSPYSTPAIILTLVAGIVVSTAYFPLSTVFSLRKMVYVELHVDILLITALVYFTGGIVSPFYFLYLLPIIVAAYFLSRRETICIAAGCFIAFGVLSDLLYLKLIPVFPGGEDFSVPLGTFVYNLTMSFLAFSGVTAISSYYFVRMRQSGEKLKSVEDDLHDVLQLNNSVLENMDHGFLTADSSGRIISFNRKVSSLLPLNKENRVVGLLVSAEELIEIVKGAGRKKTRYFEKEIEDRFLGVSVSVVDNVSRFPRLLVFLLTDLTSVKEIEKKLKEREHMALIGEMTAVLAHEIRNPLASISGAAQFLVREPGVSDEAARLMEIIVRESNRLSASIAGFLDFSRALPLHREQLDLAALIDEIVEIMQVNNREVDFIKRYNNPIEIDADQQKIRQLIWNLLSNAVKAVQGKGTVEIVFFTSGEKRCLAIRDDGMGMGEEELARLGQPFFTNFSSGFGLGMAVVKRVLKEHDYSLSINSKKGKGTEVTVCL